MPVDFLVLILRMAVSKLLMRRGMQPQLAALERMVQRAQMEVRQRAPLLAALESLVALERLVVRALREDS
jgi:hypothetical protein